MYDGSAGIGIFLIRLYEATSDERGLKEAEEAAAHIIATQVGPEWYQHTLPIFGGERNHSCAGMGGRILLQMADLLFFWILYIVALESGNIWILPVRQPNLV